MQSLTRARPVREWAWLYRVVGACALISAALLFVAGAVFMAWPPPGFDPRRAIRASGFTSCSCPQAARCSVS